MYLARIRGHTEKRRAQVSERQQGAQVSRRVLYMAHPVSPTEQEIAAVPYETVERVRGEYEDDIRHQIPEGTRVKAALRANLDSALRHLAWLRASFTETTFIAPRISYLLSGEDVSDSAARERGLVDCCAVVERCDGIVLRGPRVSSGMRRKMAHGVAVNGVTRDHVVFGDFAVYDLTSPLDVQFIPVSRGMTLDQYYERFKRGSL